MPYIEKFVRFWIEFIVGDAWEVAVGVGLTLVVLALLVDRYGASPGLGLTLVISVLVFTWIALRRATAHQ